MSNYHRPKIPNATIFFTVGLRSHGSNLLLREITLLRSAVQRTLRERPVTVHAWVVLPDHMHCIWTLPSGDHDFSTRWRIIKARFSRSLPKGPLRASDITRRERGIWNRRFWEHHIRSKADFDAHMELCWRDPVNHGLVQRPEHWEFTSFAKMKRISA
ncbi:REP-associated tyrosine transposase [Planktotalea sp.]|uniref:REP-associated tyrosine transposase n=1 Tax=Planktotalea sp. TaxID=2029877 RepID=UPI003D6A20B8